jgi:hypothetical protein
MEDPRVLLLFLVVFVALNAFGLYRALTNEAWVSKYAETHPKAALFRRLFGVEGTVWFMRRVAPWLNGTFIVLSLWLMIRIFVNR